MTPGGVANGVFDYEGGRGGAATESKMGGGGRESRASVYAQANNRRRKNERKTILNSYRSGKSKGRKSSQIMQVGRRMAAESEFAGGIQHHADRLLVSGMTSLQIGTQKRGRKGGCKGGFGNDGVMSQ